MYDLWLKNLIFKSIDTKLIQEIKEINNKAKCALEKNTRQNNRVININKSMHRVFVQHVLAVVKKKGYCKCSI